MTARCALYNWIEWAVAQIRPLEIFQDGGRPPSCIWCNQKQHHSIRRPWKPYPIEQNMKCRPIGSPVAELAIRVSWGHMPWNPHLGERGVVWVSDGTIRKNDGGFLEALYCDRCAICNRSAAICDRMSPTLKSTGGGSLWAKISWCSPWSTPLMFGSAESEHPKLTNV